MNHFVKIYRGYLKLFLDQFLLFSPQNLYCISFAAYQVIKKSYSYSILEKKITIPVFNTYAIPIEVAKKSNTLNEASCK